jgi:hypothetical protein
MEQSAYGFESTLLAFCPGHDFGATSDLATTGTALGGHKYSCVGNSGRVANNFAGVDGMAGLQALASSPEAPHHTVLSWCRRCHVNDN